VAARIQPVFGRLDRYVLREVAVPTVIGFFTYTGFMLVRETVRFSDLALQSESPLRDLSRGLGLSIPHIVVLTIPVSLLLGLLIGVGRLSSESELIAMRAAGVDLKRLYRPIGLLSTSCFGLTLALMLLVVPFSNQLLYALKLQLSTLVLADRIQPGVFSQEIAGRRFYVEGASLDRRELKGLIVTDRSDPSVESLTLAARGRIEVEESAGRLWLRLEDATTYRIQASPARTDRSAFAVQRILLQDSSPAGPSSKPFREQTAGELIESARQALTPIEGRIALVELHKKLALPAACLVFGLLGLPLGIVNRRGGKAAGFAVSIGIVLGYYILYASGEARAIDGAISPGLAMWLPNLLFFALAVFALRRARRDRPVFGGFSFGFRGRSRPARAAGPIRRFSDGPMPILDRYVLRRFLGTFVLVLTSFLALYLLIDYLEISDDIAKNNPPVALIVGYYRAFLAPVLVDTVPFAFLLAALVTTASLVRTEETTAILSHGISLLRAVASILVVATLAGGFLLYLAERVVPGAASEAERFRDRILKRPAPAAGSQRAWVRGESGQRFYAVDSFDAATGTATQISVLDLDPARFTLRRRADAESAVVIPGRGLEMRIGWVLSEDPGGGLLYLRNAGAFVEECPDAAKALGSVSRDPRQMTTPDLLRFIRARRAAGAETGALALGMYQRYTTLFSTILLTAIGIPFAFRFGKRGAAAGVGIGLLLGLSYVLLSQGILGKAGETGSLPALLAALGTPVLFALGAAYSLLGVRS